jgi:murein L,D-transpeptidase YafK
MTGGFVADSSRSKGYIDRGGKGRQCATTDGRNIAMFMDRHTVTRTAIFALLVLSCGATLAGETVDSVLVDKSDAKLYLLKDGRAVAEYSVSFGAHPKGHKQQAGDERTPEGHYILDFKKSDSAFYKAIHISYPNDADRQAAAQRGVDPGGDIMIHGQRNWIGWLSFITQRFNWTDGCIAVTNSDMDEIWQRVPVNTPIEIRE